ncbi:MAG TPA: DUF6603 domain-containing protein [Streptosporangiaceae bacterium]|nr:DUF6603 domain-containing protein [Streptosporangiaceae bacterium]
MPSTLDSVIQRVAAAFTSVGDILVTETGPGDVLALLGWDLPPGAVDIGLAVLDFSGLYDQVSDLEQAITDGDDTTIAAAFIQLASTLASFLQSIDAVISALSAPQDYLTATGIETEFVPRLFDYVIVQALKSQALVIEGAALFLGLIECDPYDADPAIYQVEHVRRVVHWDRVPMLFSNIRGLLTEVYSWGHADFDATPVPVLLGAVISGLTAPIQLRALPPRAEFMITGQNAPLATTDPMTQFLFSFQRDLGWGGIDAGVAITALRPTTPGGTDAGFAVVPYVQGGTDLRYQLSDALTFSIDTSLNVTDGIAFVFRAGSGATLRNNLTAGGVADVASGSILVTLAYADPRGTPVPLLTVIDGLGVAAGSVTVSGGADISGGVLSAIVSAGISNGSFQLNTANMDSFIASLIPLDVNFGFNLTLGWSSAHGLFIEGNASPSFALPVNVSVGPFTIQTLHIEVTPGQSDLPVELSLDGSGTLGPISVAVQRLGMTADLGFSQGNLGPVNLGLGIKPPTGLGLQIDAGLATGGGFISYDPVQGRYAGVLSVGLADIVTVNVIAVIDTKLPNGDQGFSFLMIITFDFPPVNIGFGFTINGVGGLGGVNRTMVIDALQAGLRAHDLNNILFPADPINNAPQIISEIETFFPPAQGRYLFGPMFSIGWGTPTLLDFEVGVILEVPDPVRLAILGEITATIPDPDFALISLHVQVLGTIDFGLDQLAIDGTIYDSYLLAYQLSGDMAMRLTWGSNPDFLFSLGGFNPQFHPPPGVPALKRMSVSLGSGSNPRLSASSYLAITSNTLQFGANVDAYASAGGFAVHGHVGYDVLFVFSPFSFSADFSAAFDISYDGDSFAGIQLTATFSGPEPWHLHGTASLHVLFFSVGVSIDLTCGDSTQVTLPSVAVLPPLTAALTNPGNWSAQPPATGSPGVSLRSLPAGSAQIVVQPGGTLSVRETVVPLDIPITKFDNAPPADGTEFSISAVTLNGTPVTPVATQEDFAIAQFTNMSDADKLSAPSYEPFDAGVSMGAVPIRNGHASPRVVSYQERYIDDYTLVSRSTGIYNMPAAVHDALAGSGAASAGPARITGLAAYATSAPSPLTVSGMRYLVASTADLTQRSDILTSASTHYQARAAMRAYLAANPDQQDHIQLIPAYQVAA